MGGSVAGGIVGGRWCGGGVEGAIHYGGFGGPHHFGYGIEVGGGDALHALEMDQEGVARLGANAGNLVESRHGLALGAAVAVVGDTESVGLVAERLHHPEALAVFVDIEGHRVAGEIYLFQSLRDAHYGYAPPEAHRVERLDSRRELPLATIDDYELRQIVGGLGH